MSKDKERRDKRRRNKTILILMVGLVIPLSIIGLVVEVGGQTSSDNESMGDLLAIVPMIIVIVIVLVVMYILTDSMRIKLR